jgi:acrosin
MIFFSSFFNCGLTHLNDRDNNEFNARIADGTEAEQHKYPWMVSIVYPDSANPSVPKRNHLCGGVIINSHFTLTAGHCTLDYIK